jgi:hypothetical protein
MHRREQGLTCNRTTMHPRITELLSYLDAQTEALRAIYDAIPLGQRATRRDPARWSPAEVIHQLAIVERRLTLRLAVLIEQARALPGETETSSILATSGATRAMDRSYRLVTSEALEPRDTDPAAVWDELMDARRELIRVIGTGNGLALGSVSGPHPALGSFSGYDWIVFIGAHAARHAEQIREMAA